MKSYANQIKHKIETKSMVVVTSNLLKDSGNSVETPRKVCAHGINYLNILRYCTQRCSIESGVIVVGSVKRVLDGNAYKIGT